MKRKEWKTIDIKDPFIGNVYIVERVDKFTNAYGTSVYYSTLFYRGDYKFKEINLPLISCKALSSIETEKELEKMLKYW